MGNPERPIVATIAGPTSTGKTELGMATAALLQDTWGYDVKFFPIGNIFRAVAPRVDVYSSESIPEQVQHLLNLVHITDTESFDIKLSFDGEQFIQSHKNGIDAAPLSTPVVNGLIKDFITTKIIAKRPNGSILILDGRQRFADGEYPQILFYTTGSHQTRTEILSVEREECAGMTPDEIYKTIQERDKHEIPLLLDLRKNIGENVVFIRRTSSSEKEKQYFAEKTAEILVDFSRGELPPKFGTLYLPPPR